MAESRGIPCDTMDAPCQGCPFANPEQFHLDDKTLDHLKRLIGIYGLEGIREMRENALNMDGTHPNRFIELVEPTVEPDFGGDIYEREHLLADAVVPLDRCDTYLT